MTRPPLTSLLILLPLWAAAAPLPAASRIDAAVLAAAPGRIVTRLDLTAPFAARTPWTFVAVQAPPTTDPFDKTELPGPITFCLVHDVSPDCAGPAFPPQAGQTRAQWQDSDNHRVLDARIAAGRLLLAAQSAPSGDGDRLLSNFVLSYDRTSDTVVGAFANATPRNNNQQTRLVEAGPLAGDIIVDEPTQNAPFTYFITVYAQAKPGRYETRLRYRGKTVYGDGNKLAVIDSEMPEILQRLHVRHAGDPLPVPPVMPAACHALEMRGGVEWCK
jgi:hypothetical protein